ncbi:MAG: hypothetical protein M0Q13_10425 [Methanothrix sp.]|nr:hypothetical protein [Methanothrix sp.]
MLQWATTVQPWKCISDAQLDAMNFDMEGPVCQRDGGHSTFGYAAW